MKEDFKNILVPIDHSLQSRTAQEMAVFISKLFNSQVTLLHVVSNELPILAGQTYSPREDFVPLNTATLQFPRTISLPRPRENVFPNEIVQEITERYREIGKATIADSVVRFTRAGLKVKEKVVEGSDVADSIISETEAGDYDLIIMGNSGNEENELDLHLGSVAHKVALRAKNPTLIVRNKREIRKILVPVEGSTKEEKAIQEAQSIAMASGSTAILLHAQETSLLKIRPEIREMGIHILEQAANMMPGINLEKKLVSDDPANAIIQTAKQEDADLIVIRRGGLGPLKRLFLGSVSDHVLHYATVPVMLVK